MKKTFLWLVLLAPFVAVPAVRAQAIGEFGAVQGLGAGLGAGLAGSLGGGKLFTKSFDAAIQAQQSVAYQTKAIEQYVKMGYQYEAGKQWENADRAYKYALQMIARKDGVGSEKSVPVLQRLVRVDTVMNNIGDAINYQRTLVGFAKRSQSTNPINLVSAQTNLGSLYMSRNDYTNAEIYLKDSVALYDANPGMTEGRQKARQNYATVLHLLNKHSEASAIEEADRNNATASGKPKASQDRAVAKTPAATPTTTPPATPSVTTSVTARTVQPAGDPLADVPVWTPPELPKELVKKANAAAKKNQVASPSIAPIAPAPRTTALSPLVPDETATNAMSSAAPQPAATVESVSTTTQVTTPTTAAKQDSVAPPATVSSTAEQISETATKAVTDSATQAAAEPPSAPTTIEPTPSAPANSITAGSPSTTGSSTGAGAPNTVAPASTTEPANGSTPSQLN